MFVSVILGLIFTNVLVSVERHHPSTDRCWKAPVKSSVLWPSLQTRCDNSNDLQLFTRVVLEQLLLFDRVQNPGFSVWADESITETSVMQNKYWWAPVWWLQRCCINHFSMSLDFLLNVMCMLVCALHVKFQPLVVVSISAAALNVCPASAEQPQTDNAAKLILFCVKLTSALSLARLGAHVAYRTATVPAVRSSSSADLTSV